MSDYQPKVGDWVMVGEHGPYEVKVVDEHHKTVALLLHKSDNPVLVTVGTALWSWLTPAPEPEPDEPTAHGALVRDGQGRLLARDHDDEWLQLAGPSAIAGDWFEWSSLPRPITVVVADPAEVETLRAEVEDLRTQRDALFAERDKLSRRIDGALRYLDSREALLVAKRAASILRGKS